MNKRIDSLDITFYILLHNLRIEIFMRQKIFQTVLLLSNTFSIVKAGSDAIIIKEVQRYFACTRTCYHILCTGCVSRILYCPVYIACVTADGILIAKSILNYHMTAHLRCQVALLSRARCTCTRISDAMYIYDT